MQEIEYRNQKAYLLTTDDLFELDKHPSSNTAIGIKAKVSSARRDSVKYVFIITSLKKISIPIWLRHQITTQKNCFVISTEMIRDGKIDLCR
jgi:hypothetical protein